jgi:hypothetical protein
MTRLLKAALALLLAPGCLYVGEVNRAPSASLTIVDPPKTLIKGATLTLMASMSDPEDGGNLPPVWAVSSADGAQPDGCDFRLAPFPYDHSGNARAEVTFYRTGNWIISFQTFDHFRAPSNTSTVMVQVVDAPPTFSKSDLSAKEAKDVQCNTYTAGQPLTLFYDGTVEDPDADVLPAGSGCAVNVYNESFRYRWEIVGLPGTSHAVLGPKPSKNSMHLGDADCPATPAPGLDKVFVPGPDDYPLAVCVYPDEGGATVPEMYQVALYVSDGTTEIRTNVFDAPVRADLPPCLTGAAPTPGSYVVDRMELQRFTVTGAIDDLDPFASAGLSYQWSLWREQDPAWRVVPDWTLPTYELDISGFTVGEKIRVRVQPADRNGVRTTCDVDQSSCTIDSCLTQTCNGWMTWDLELR